MSKKGFPCSSAGKESACNAGDPSSIPGSERSPPRRDRLPTLVFLGFLGGSVCKESACSEGDLGLIPGLGRSLGGRHGNPLQYSCLQNLRDRGAWWAAVHRVAKSRTRLKRLSTHTYLDCLCPWDSPGMNTRVGCYGLDQEFFPTQGSNPHLLYLLH